MVDHSIEQLINASGRTSAKELANYKNLVRLKVQIEGNTLEASEETISKLNAEIARLEAIKYETITEES